MPQIQIPIFPAGVTHITNNIAFQCEDGKVCYLNGHLPVFIHDQRASVVTKSNRSEIDSQTLMGVATTRTLERVAAALGELRYERTL